MNAEDIVVLLNTKDYAQYIRAIDNLNNRPCPFCEIDKKLNHILHENESWMIWQSAFPQAHQDLHLIIPSKRHVSHFHELTKKEFLDLHEMLHWANENFSLPGGGLALRFGDPRRNAASVPHHLHWNIQIPSGDGAVSIVLAKSKEYVAGELQRALVYEKIRTGTPYDSLSKQEKEVIKDRYPTLKL
jgi:diadenosine tetraphosphate (Ap4A) HIT family hydrolase